MHELKGNILVTGGTGSLGKAVLNIAKRDKWRSKFAVFSRDETKQNVLKRQFPEHTYILGDVSRYDDISRAVRGYRPDIILHFAAYKQIPAAQNNVYATVETNVRGSQNVIDAALEYGVPHVAASSTDKACEPANVYGSSKNLMEGLFQDANKWKQTNFHLARYGNVVCSNSSVIPLFLKQKEEGNSLTVTRKEMTRFWISLEQAVSLICSSLQLTPGTILVPKAGAMSMESLATYLGGEGDIKEIGIREGEKIHECMVSESESFHTCSYFDGYYHIYPPTGDYENALAPFSYCSNDPSRILAGKEIDLMIEVAKLLGS